MGSSQQNQNKTIPGYGKQMSFRNRKISQLKLYLVLVVVLSRKNI